MPITTKEDYQLVFRDRLQLDALHPRARVWVGVSSADDQSYVDDELPSTVPNGGRPGNESSVATAAAEARFLGRPQFVVPAPLPAVPEVVVDEPAGDGVLAAIDLRRCSRRGGDPGGPSRPGDRIPLEDVVGCLRANANGTVVRPLSGATASYSLGNPGQPPARAIASGEPRG